MKGLFLHSHARDSVSDPTADLTLLAKSGKLEVMTQDIRRSAVAWLAPAEKEDAFEFYYLISGKMEIVEDDCVTPLEPGDSITLQGLQQNVMLRCVEDAQVLCVTTSPVFSEHAYRQKLMMEQLRRIDEKDHYTLNHSQRVMHYATRLYEALGERCSDIILSDFVVGCLFHDIGKVNIPTAILSKPARLTEEEYTVMKRHCIESSNILEPLFGARVAALARKHHERLDGSGYPAGLSGDEISFPARILMVADAFDAMTSNRVYRKACSAEDAALELASLPEKYDSVVVDALLLLLRKGALTTEILD